MGWGGQAGTGRPFFLISGNQRFAPNGKSMKIIDEFTAALDRKAVGPRQLLIVGLVLAALIIDGLDVQILALVSPIIIAEWSVTRTVFGPALAAALAGMAVGSFLGGWLGDRLGRRAVLVASVVFFGIVTLTIAWTHGVVSIALLRFLSGLGFGAAMPNGMALATEWLPARVRARAITVLAVGVPLGGMIGAPLTMLVVPEYGWRGCFVACGVFTLVVAGLMLRGVPESPSFLLGRGRAGEAARSVRSVLGISLSATSGPQEVQAKAVVKGSGLLGRANLRMNLGLWTVSFCTAAFTYSIAAWGPVLLTGNGFSLDEAIRASFFHNAAGIVAAVSASAMLNRFGSSVLLPLALGLCVVLVGGIGATLLGGEVRTSGASRTLVIALWGLVGATAGFSTATVYTLLSLGYPPEYRSTAIGAGITIGRTGAITMVWLGGVLLDFRQDGIALLATMAVGLCLAIVGALTLDRHVQPARA